MSRKSKTLRYARALADVEAQTTNTTHNTELSRNRNRLMDR
jgi:hypothetical protein